jgi:hypothetical protein
MFNKRAKANDEQYTLCVVADVRELLQTFFLPDINMFKASRK